MLVTSGVKVGERVILTALTTVTQGMEVRVSGETTADAKGEAKP